MFTRKFLRNMYGKLSLNKVRTTTDRLDDGVVKLPRTVELASLFASMTPYLDPEVKPKSWKSMPRSASVTRHISRQPSKKSSVSLRQPFRIKGTAI